MKKLLVLLFCAPLLMATQCDDDDNGPINCTQEFVPGLRILVKDADTGAVLEEGVTVIAVEGNYTENLTLTTGSASAFVGAWERGGTYILTVTKAGYETHTSAGIEVGADACHVITESRTILLQPE